MADKTELANDNYMQNDVGLKEFLLFADLGQKCFSLHYNSLNYFSTKVIN